MATQLHKDMVKAASVIFPHLDSDHTLRRLNFLHKPLSGLNTIPDLAAPDKSLAIECETLGKDKRERFKNHSEQYSNIILVLPLLKKVREIWMYDEGKFQKFKIEKEG